MIRSNYFLAAGFLAIKRCFCCFCFCWGSGRGGGVFCWRFSVLLLVLRGNRSCCCCCIFVVTSTGWGGAFMLRLLLLLTTGLWRLWWVCWAILVCIVVVSSRIHDRSWHTARNNGWRYVATSFSWSWGALLVETHDHCWWAAGRRLLRLRSCGERAVDSDYRGTAFSQQTLTCCHLSQMVAISLRRGNFPISDALARRAILRRHGVSSVPNKLTELTLRLMVWFIIQL